MMSPSCSNPPSCHSQCSFDCQGSFAVPLFCSSTCCIILRKEKHYYAAVETPTLLSAPLTWRHGVSSRLLLSWAQRVPSQGFRMLLLE